MNKKVKRILLLIALMFAATLAIHTNKSYAAECTAGICTYAYDLVDGKAENVYISKYNGGNIPSKTIVEVRMPDTLDGYTINSVGNGVTNIINKTERECIREDGYNYWVRIYLPTTVTKINDYALSTLQIEEETLEIPSSVKTIGEWAFANTNFHFSGGTLTIPSSVREIGNYAFANLLCGPFVEHEERSELSQHQKAGDCSYYTVFPNRGNNIVIESGVTKIGKYAFLNNAYYNSITIPASVTEIGRGAFFCSSFSSINFSARESSNKVIIGSYAFSRTNITSFNVQSSFVLIPEGTYTDVGLGAWKKCTKLESVTFDDGIETIPDQAFSGCDKLENVTKTASLKKINNSAFYGCKKISNSEYQDIISNIIMVGDSAFFGCTGITGTITIPTSISQSAEYTAMGNGVFQNCSNIEKVNIQSNITKIPDRTFTNCEKLNDLTKPNTITEIGESAFANCKSISTSEYNDIITNVTKIGSNAFSSCTGLTGKVDIGNRTIGTYVFARCTNIAEAEISNTSSKLPEGTFYGCTSLTKFSKPSSMTSIGKKAFADCTSLSMERHNEIVQNVKQIGASAFKGDTGISGKLIVKNIVTEIGESAYENCINISEIEFEDDAGRQDLGEKCFYNTAKLQETYRIHAVPQRYETNTIGNKAFSNAREVFTDNYYSNTALQYKWYGDANSDAIVHYGNCTHKIEITCTLPGVSLVNPDNDETLSTVNVNCEEDFRFKLKIDEGWESKYPDMAFKVISEGKYSNSDFVETILDIENGKTYTLNNVTRNKKIVMLAKENGTDLVLRQFISKVNDEKLVYPRDIKVKENKEGITSFDYNHRKVPLEVKEKDKLTFKIRVYNEGTAQGEANQIKVRLQDGIAYDDTNPENNEYGWSVLEDGTLQTEYLRDKKIPAYTSGKPQYEEIQLICKVTAKQTNEDQYLVSVAEIASGNDVDSAEDTIGLINLVDYKKEESQSAWGDSYLLGEEDDTDHECVIIRGSSNAIGYKIIVNKIDSLSNELLDGAKINLIDSDKTTIISQGITENGVVTFDGICTYGAGIDTYYISEEEAPEGYIKTIDGLIELQVVKGSSGVYEVVFDVDATDDDIELNSDVENESLEFIPIYTKEQLLKIGSNEHIEINGTQYEFKENANYKLMQDISMNGYEDKISPIKYMNGVFDGNNKSITGIYLEDYDNEEAVTVKEYSGFRNGLFRYFEGEVRDLTLEFAGIYGNYYSDAREYVTSTGGFAGYVISGKFKNCNVKAPVISGCHNLGGIVGESYGKVIFEDCTSETHNFSGKCNAGDIIGCSREIQMIRCENTAGGGSYSTGCNAGGLIGNAVGDTYVKNSSNHKIIPASGCNDIGGIIGHVSTGATVNIENCTNDAAINAYNNAGGIIGSSDGLCNIVNCNNTGAVTATYTAGGIVGESRGPINIVDCENSGEINATYNVGGIVGKSQASVAVMKNANVQLGEDGHAITLYIKNKKANQLYNLNIIKVDLTKAVGSQTLTGAKFNVYDSNGQLIKENAEVNSSGVLTVEKIPLNSVNEDVFYITEAEAPQGYNILVRNPIKVRVTKTWDKTKQKYILGISATLEESVQELEPNSSEDIEKETLDYNTGNNNNIRYKSNKTAILRCNNAGKISGQLDCGGIAGIVLGYSNIEDCENNAERVVVTSGYGVAGGIVGHLMRSNPKEESYVSGCTNNGAVAGSNAGGIIGESSTVLDVYNCENNGNITPSSGGSCGGGIVARALLISNIDNCTNNANISGFGMGGGIVGSSLIWNYYVQRNNIELEPNYMAGSITITNCNQNGENITGGQFGGILGISNCQDTTIKDCYVNNSYCAGNSSNGGSGGILGVSAGENLYVERCKVSESSIISSGNVTAGIVGSRTNYGNLKTGISSSVTFGRICIDVKDCEVLGCTIITSGDHASGIVSCGQIQDAYTTYINIENCTVKAYNQKESKISGASASGVLSGSYILASSSFNVNIDNCDVDGTTIIATGGYSAAGIMGTVNSAGRYGYINIKDCDVKNLEITINGQVTAGIFCGIYDAANINCSIDGCNVENVIFNNACNNAGAIYAYQYNGGIWNELKFKDCKVKNCKMEGSYYESVGGIVGLLYGQVYELDGCEVSGLKIKGESKNKGGLIGAIWGRDQQGKANQIKNCKVTSGYDDKEQPVKTELGGTNSVVGGVIGSIFSDNNNMEIDSLQCDNIEFSGAVKPGGSIGGIIGTCYGTSMDMSNVDISNIHVSTEDNYSTSIGGLIGSIANHNNSSTVINGIRVNNIDIGADKARVAGLIAYVGGSNSTYRKFNDIVIDNLKAVANDSEAIGGLIAIYDNNNIDISNVEIKNSNLSVSKVTGELSGYDRGYAAAGLVAMCTGYANVEGVTVKNTNITTAAADGSDLQRVHAAGLVGVARGEYGLYLNVDDCTVNDVTINNYASPMGTTGGIVGAFVGTQETLNITNSDVNNLTANSNYAVGGILGCGTATINTCTVTNPKINANMADSEYLIPDAIAGGAVGIAVEDSEIENVNVTADDSESIICSDNLAGGIAGINSGELRASSVANIIVKTMLKFIQNLTTAPQEGETVETVAGSAASNEKCADAIQARAMKAYENCTENSVTVICGE